MASPSPSRGRFALFALAAAVVCVCFPLAEPALWNADGSLTSKLLIMSDQTVEPVAILVLALPLGVLIDRTRPRSVLVLSALLGAAALASVPAAGALGAPTWPLLLAVMPASGVLAMVTGLARDACLPSVVRPERLLPANVLLLALLPQIVVVPMKLTGAVWQGPAFLFATGLALAVAAALFRGVSTVEEPPPPRAGLRRETAEGIRFTARHPALRAIAFYLVLSALVAEITAAAAGEAWETAFRGLNGAGSGPAWWLMSAPAYVPPVLGALVALLLHRRLGTFRLAWWALIVTGPFTLLLALSGTGPGWVWYVLGAVVPRTGSLVASVALLSHRQTVTPRRLLGRTGAVLVVLTSVADGVAGLLEGPAERLAELGGVAPAAVATVAALATAVPLLRARRSADHDATRPPITGVLSSRDSP
ncbi:MFS transporter [Microbispora hainanensis]|uniref:MFS transporter n=1 Tax=Microbispora hainanensis TaxID=568844 RepID=A0A544YZY2_9ACTN|nr:MFS transporter [Microbispora hainanensis]TQS22346.1 MFS transporter [Microbispora hainanensis]